MPRHAINLGGDARFFGVFLLCFKAKYLELCRISAEGQFELVPLFRLPPASLPRGAELAGMSWDPTVLWQPVLYNCCKQ